MTEVREAASPVRELAGRIVSAIREGHLAPGQRLVEAEFAKRWSVARSTVREAFQRLEVEGLLASERHRGFLVRALSRARVREVYEMREALDGQAARLAAPAIQASPAPLAACMDALEAARLARDLRGFTRQNQTFHEIIRTAAGNTLLATTLESLETSVYALQFRLLVERSHVFDSQDEHRLIFDALVRGDAVGAEAASRTHVRRSLDELMALPDAVFAAA